MIDWYFRPKDNPRILQQKADIETLKERESKLTEQLDEVKAQLQAAE